MASSGRKKRDPALQPVKELVLSDKNRMLRLILIGVFLLIALIAFTVGLFSALNTEPGWETVDCGATEVNCSGDFIFSYCYGQTEENPTSEKKRLSNLYSQAVIDAWQIFYTDVENLNKRVNTAVTVDPALYDAFALIQSYHSRCIYLAPVYEAYGNLFAAQSDTVAAQYDPAQDGEQAAYLEDLIVFTSDPSMVNLKLLPDHQVCLTVAPEYLQYAEENEITRFLDFGWMRNAFIADYLAETVAAEGFTNGFLSSYDGFTRNLDDRGEEFSLNLFNRRGTDIYLAGTMSYSRPISIVFLRDYPMSQRDQNSYYTFQNGKILSDKVDPADGLCKSATDSLVSYSYEMGCAEVLLQQMPVFVADALDANALAAMQDAGISSIWFDAAVLTCNDAAMQIKLNPDSGVDYTLKYVN